MKKISEKLYQASAVFGFELPKEVTVVFWLCEGFPEKLPSTKVTFLNRYIPDSEEGLDAEVFESLVDDAETYKDATICTVCAMGENRSGLMSVLTLIARGEAPYTAIETVQKNGNMNSNVAQHRGHSFWNTGFARQVKEYFE